MASRDHYAERLGKWREARMAKLDHQDCVEANLEVHHTWEDHWSGKGPRGEMPVYDPVSESEERFWHGDK